jgi:hypothetical protein
MSIVAAFLMCLHSMFGVQHGYTNDQVNSALSNAYQTNGVSYGGPGSEGLIAVVDTISMN